LLALATDYLARFGDQDIGHRTNGKHSKMSGSLRICGTVANVPCKPWFLC